MKDLKTQGIILKKDAKGRYIWKEKDDPEREVSFEVGLRKPVDDWCFDLTKIVEGSIAYIHRIDADGSEFPESVSRESIGNTIAYEMREGCSMYSSTLREDLIEYGRTLPLSSGISVDVEGVYKILCNRFTDSDLAHQADAVVEEINVQNILFRCEELARNGDKPSRYMIVDQAEDKDFLGKVFSIDALDDMDMIVECQARTDVRGNLTNLQPLQVFHLSKSPRFDYDSRTLQGVSKCYTAEGKDTYHGDIWPARAIMRRLPGSDKVHEDTSNYIDIALDGLVAESPSPS